MSGSLDDVLNCVELFVNNIKHKRDLILGQLNGRQCLPSKQLSLLLNTFVDQLLDKSDETSAQTLVAITAVEEDSDCVHTSNDTHMKNRLKSLETCLKTSEKECQRLRNRLKTSEAKEVVYKKQMNELRHEIQKFKKFETNMKKNIKDLKQLFNNKTNDNSFENRIKYEIKEEIIKRELISFKEEINDQEIGSDSETELEVMSDSDSNDTSDESDNEKLLRDRCLSSDLSINLGNRVCDRSHVSHEEEERDIDSDSDSVTEVETSGRQDVYKDKRRYVVVRPRDGLEYVCNSFGCEYKTNSLNSIREHRHKSPALSVRPSQRTSEVVCSDCGLKCKSSAGLARHISAKHKKRVEKSRAPIRRTGRSYSDPSAPQQGIQYRKVRNGPKMFRRKCTFRRAVKRELINELIDLND